MSDNRKVIHVKDLVIKADNVYFDRSDRRHRDPFFGGRHDDERVEGAEDREHDDRDDESSNSDSDDNQDRGPFSWI